MKSFLVVAVMDDKEYEAAWGRSKKEGEQNAAMATLRVLKTARPEKRDSED